MQSVDAAAQLAVLGRPCANPRRNCGSDNNDTSTRLSFCCVVPDRAGSAGLASRRDRMWTTSWPTRACARTCHAAAQVARMPQRVEVAPRAREAARRRRGGRPSRRVACSICVTRAIVVGSGRFSVGQAGRMDGGSQKRRLRIRRTRARSPAVSAGLRRSSKLGLEPVLDATWIRPFSRRRAHACS